MVSPRWPSVTRWVHCAMIKFTSWCKREKVARVLERDELLELPFSGFIHLTARLTARRWYWFHEPLHSFTDIRNHWILHWAIDRLFIGSRHWAQEVQTPKEITILQIRSSFCQFSFPFTKRFSSPITFPTFVFINSCMQIVRYCFPHHATVVWRFINELQFICVAMARYLHINKSGKRFNNQWIFLLCIICLDSMCRDGDVRWFSIAITSRNATLSFIGNTNTKTSQLVLLHRQIIKPRALHGNLSIFAWYTCLLYESTTT